MPSVSNLLKRAPKPEPSQMYVAVESHVAGPWSEYVVRRGDRLLGSSPALAYGFPKYYLKDGASTEELNAARQKLYSFLTDEPPTPAPDQFTPRIGEPSRNRMRAIRDVYAPANGTASGLVVLAQQGTVFEATHWVVKQHRADFEAVPAE